MISPPRRPHSPRWRACGRALSRLYTPSARRRRDPLARALWTIERFVAITRLLYVYVYLCTTTSRGTSELPSNTHTDPVQRCTRQSEILAFHLLKRRERYVFFTQTHSRDHSHQSRVLYTACDPQTVCRVTPPLHSPRAFDSRVPTCHKSTRSVARPFANARAAFYWQSHASQRRPKAPTHLS